MILVIISNNDTWISKAKCKGLTHIFFASYSERPQTKLQREDRAKSICTTCSAVDECRRFGRDNCEIGVWGGETEEDRWQLGYRNVADPSLKRRMSRATF